MSATQFCINWVSHKNSISKGFSALQQNGEFVDMTLAAEGYLVKVHQNMMALASPYLKAMILSAACQHPVVFLSNISHETLGFILEYIYTGEVNLPTDVAPAFVEACKALCINGVEHLILPKRVPQQMTQTQPENVDSSIERVTHAVTNPITDPVTDPPDNNFAAHITINSDNYNVEVIPMDNNPIQENTQPIICLDEPELLNIQPNLPSTTLDSQNNMEQNNAFPFISFDYKQTDIVPLSSLVPPPAIVSGGDHESNINSDHYTNHQNINYQSVQNVDLNLRTEEIQPILPKAIKTIAPSIGGKDRPQHYTISNRGSLQLLLNNYMYHCHHQSCEGRKRRWRCADYRKLHCPAFVDTKDDDIVNRSENHTHGYHHNKILRKFKAKSVFTSIIQAEENVDTFKTFKKKPPKGRSKRILKSEFFGNSELKKNIHHH